MVLILLSGVTGKNAVNITIEGVPRVLDAGQCNDSYSLALLPRSPGKLSDRTIKINTQEAVLMKGHVDKDICIGCGLCEEICPDVFRMDDDGKAVAKEGEIPDNLIDSAKDAESQCPVEAIKVE